VNHFATPDFWFHYRRLPPETRELADRCFAMLQADPRHPSLRLKRVGAFWSARVGLRIRALARDRPEGLVWFCPDKVSEVNWGVVKDWTEESRYERKTQAQAQQLIAAITDAAHGVLPWIKQRW